MTDVQGRLLKPQTFELEIENPNGTGYTGRIRGECIAVGRHDVSVYLTDDERVLVHDERRLAVHDVTNDPEGGLRDLLDDDAFAEAADALGIKVVIDL